MKMPFKTSHNHIFHICVFLINYRYFAYFCKAVICHLLNNFDDLLYLVTNIGILSGGTALCLLLQLLQTVSQCLKTHRIHQEMVLGLASRTPVWMLMICYKGKAIQKKICFKLLLNSDILLIIVKNFKGLQIRESIKKFISLLQYV